MGGGGNNSQVRIRSVISLLGSASEVMWRERAAAHIDACILHK